MTDRDLLHALRSGRSPSADAYGRLLDAYGEELYRRCILVLRDRDAAHVVLRDTLIVAHAHILRLSDADRLGEWLHALAEAECQRHRERCRTPPDGDSRPLALPEKTDLVRARVLNGMSRPELDGYRTHVAARADHFGRDGFPLRPGSRRVPRTPLLSFVLALLCALLVLALAGYVLARGPVHELGTDAPLGATAP
ncbi:RNA polymerase sigma factor [Nocardiopsis ganjiahuensis]|uniref:RNA polymerase sigma factor n=1 Tax=Nocardiopsis ganjiahuensis TaxID=239984 RepID=UPI00034B8BB2|nr:hypothetical protein [Nocardiopsis ganjiahuensis]